MRSILFVVLIVAFSSSYAQNPAPIKPSYFFSGQLTSVDSFNAYLLQALPDFHLIRMDSSSLKDWSFMYTNNEVYNNVKNRVSISYQIEAVAGNPALHMPLSYGIKDVRIEADFLTLAKLYNKFVGQSTPPEELFKSSDIHGPIAYAGNPNKYWMNFDHQWIFFRKL